MNQPRPSARIIGIELIVADLGRATAFYHGLGFTVDGPDDGDRQVLTFGAFTLRLDRTTGGSRPYPSPHRANDPWFQHFAIAVADMPRAFAALATLGGTPISRGGPQQLPPSTGSVVAYKFRDPDGHPLELSFIPGSAWLADAVPEVVFLGVDHTAVAVADLAASIAFYEGLGFAVTGRGINTGAEQDRLDGLDGVTVDIVVMSLPARGPHLELLGYRAPEPAVTVAIDPLDIAATRTVLATNDGLQLVRDPDGHFVMLETIDR